MRLHAEPEAITDDDTTIAAMVRQVPTTALLATVAHLTGDLDLVPDDLRPDLSQVLAPNDGYPPEQIERAADLAAAALARHRDAGSPTLATDPASLRRIVEFVAGAPQDDDHHRLLAEELALAGDPRSPGWTVADVAPDRSFRVGVIGAGMSGLVVAHRLRQAGVDVVVFEKNADVGGTWLENDYPGCRVDIASHFYCYSFAQTPDWAQYNATQPDLLDYFRTCTDELDLRRLIRFETEVTEACWDDDACCWQLHTDGVDGPADHTVEALVSAVGQLNRPFVPDLAGLDTFAGPSFHSARWDHDVELAGRDVGIIGTGASAVQFISALAGTADRLTVYQRTPPWLLPVDTYTADLPDGVRWLRRIAPGYVHWDRLRMFTRTDTGLLPFAEVADGWDDGGRTVGPTNAQARDLLAAWFEIAFPDPGLRAAVLPDYPPTAKRMVLDDGTYAAALARPDVELITDPIVEVTPTGVRTAEGTDRTHDVLILGTGFTASQFLAPMRVVGRNGVDLHERWGGDARAHLGITIPDMPNLFVMYGPNTNIVINGSIIFFSECEATYITDCVRELLTSGRRAFAPRPEVHDAYNERIDAGNRRRAWGVSDVNSWYRNELGRVAQNWPFDLFTYWDQTRRVDPADHEWW